MESNDKDQEMTDVFSASQNDAEGESQPSTHDHPPATDSFTVKSLAIPTPQISNNDPAFKYKYPEARPTPPGEDDTMWNKVYTAADSRMYNKHSKDASNSRKFRVSGETRILAIKMLEEKKVKQAGGGPLRATPKPKVSVAKKPAPKKEPYTGSRDETPGLDMMSMSISEKIKSDGRTRKALSAAPASKSGTPAPSSTKPSSPAPPATKIEKPAPKKKRSAHPVNKLKQKRPSPDANGILPTPKSRPGQTPGPTAAGASSESESNDGREYCICRGPDDHRMMVACEGGCGEWYHCECLKMDVDDANELLDRFICHNCIHTGKKTTYKRMCRYYNVDKACRKAARVQGDPPSKYCSDEHREAFWVYVQSLMRSGDEPSMGGALSQAEFGALLKHSKTAAEFHALGQKPRLPVREGADASLPVGLGYLTEEEEGEIEEIEIKKREIHRRIQCCKDQSKLLAMIHERAKLALKQPNLPNKDLCGYDSRLGFNNLQFLEWHSSDEGRKAFATGILGPRTEETIHINAIIPVPESESEEKPKPKEKPKKDEEDPFAITEPLMNVCLNKRKGCWHFNWREIHNQDYVDTQNNLREELGKLEKAKNELIDGAETREATKEYYADNIVIQLF